jgi:phosphopantetheinyl transferase
MAQSHSRAAAPWVSGQVHVAPVGVWSDAPASEFPEVPPWLVLDGGVRRRISRLHSPHDRRSAITARALTVLAVAEVLDVLPDEVRLRQECPQCRRDDHGLPSVQGLADIHVSWAHTRWRVAAAASPLPVAVDTEERIKKAESLTHLTLTAEEQAWLDPEHDPDAFTRLWCRKECAVKMGWIDLDRLTEISFCAEGSLLDRLRGGHVVDRSVRGRAVVAITLAELRWAPVERLRTTVATASRSSSAVAMSPPEPEGPSVDAAEEQEQLEYPKHRRSLVASRRLASPAPRRPPALAGSSSPTESVEVRSMMVASADNLRTKAPRSDPE